MADYRFHNSSSSNNINNNNNKNQRMSSLFPTTPSEEFRAAGASLHRYSNNESSELRGEFDSHNHQQNHVGVGRHDRSYSMNSNKSTSGYENRSPPYNHHHDNNQRRWSTASSISNPPYGHSSEQKKRKRIQQACKACSFRRVKCNGQKPCETCIKNDEECIYGQAKKRGPAKGTTRGGGKKNSDQRGELDSSASHYDHQQYPHQQHQHRRSTEASSYAGSNSSFTSPPFLPSPRSQYDHVEFSRLPKEYSSSNRQHSSSVSDPRMPFGDPYIRRQSLRESVDNLAYDHQRRQWVGQSNMPSRTLPLPSDSRHSRPSFSHPSSSSRSTGMYEFQADPSHSSYEEDRMMRNAKRSDPSFKESDLRSKIKLAGKLHQSMDIGGQELADLVLSQLYEERQKVNKSKHANRESNDTLFESDETGGDKVIPENLQLPRISEEVVKKLFNVFWSVISLHWPLFLRKVYPTVDDLYKMCESDHPFLLNAICSLSALVWDSTNDGGKLDTTERGTSLSARQLSTIFAVRAHYHHIGAILNPNIESTAALLFLSLRETGAGRPSQAAHYCWTACRMAMDLGLHRQAEMAQIMGASFTQIEDETRRRVYWGVYVIDKMMAVQLGRPPVLRDAESDCPLPSFEGEENVWTWDNLPHKFFSAETNRQLGSKPLNMATYFTNGCRLARISEPIVAQYNVVKGKQTIDPTCSGVMFNSAGCKNQTGDWQSTIAFLHRQLEEWDEKTPMNLRWYANKGEAYFPYIIHQQMWAQACRILLHRPYILKPTDKVSGINSHAECSKATDAIWQMFRDYERLFSLRKVPSSTVYCLFSAATIALANTTSVEDVLCVTAKRQLKDIVGWFIHLTETWSSATQHLAILEKLASTINVDLSETGLQEPSLRAALYSKLDTNTMGMFGAERLRKQTFVSDGKSGVSVMEDIPSFSKYANSNSLANSPNKSVSPFNDQTRGGADSNLGERIGGGGGNDIVGLGVSGGGGGAESTEEQLDAFWPDMPLGDDFQRWLSFTHTYFTILGNASNDGENSVKDQKQQQSMNINLTTKEPQQSGQESRSENTKMINGLPASHSPQLPQLTSHRSTNNRSQFDRIGHLSSTSTSSPSSESFYPIPPYKI